MTGSRGGEVFCWPEMPDAADYLPGAIVAVVTTTTVGHVAAATRLEADGWTIRDTIRWHTGGRPVRHALLARRPLLIQRWEERIAPTVARHQTALLHLAAVRVPGARPSSATRWPPNLILQHHADCARPATPRRHRVSVASFKGCVDGCPISVHGMDSGSRPVAVLAPHLWSDEETIGWISALIEPPPVCITGV